MKTPPHIIILATKDTIDAKVPFEVCMHVLGTVGAAPRMLSRWAGAITALPLSTQEILN